MISFVVLAYNEEEHLAATIQSLKDATIECGISDNHIEAIIVDDGSTDRTPEVIKEIMAEHQFVRTVVNPVNLGMGGAIKKGMEAVRFERFLIVPGDNDMNKDFLLLMLRFRDSAEMVMAFPVNLENRNMFRNILSHFYRNFYMIGFRAFVNYINGPCIYPTERVRALDIRSNGFSLISEISTKLLRSGCTFCEVPGYFQTGVRPRGTVSLKNFIEVAVSYIRLLSEVHFFKRNTFNKTPRRIFIDFTGSRRIDDGGK